MRCYLVSYTVEITAETEAQAIVIAAELAAKSRGKLNPKGSWQAFRSLTDDAGTE